MYVVIGTWPIGPTAAGDDGSHADLSGVAEAVRRVAGFVQAYCGVEAGDETTAHAVVVFDTRAHATAFAAGMVTSLGRAHVSVVRVV
jgi:hypothetical protein